MQPTSKAMITKKQILKYSAFLMIALIAVTGEGSNVAAAEQSPQPTDTSAQSATTTPPTDTSAQSATTTQPTDAAAQPEAQQKKDVSAQPESALSAEESALKARVENTPGVLIRMQSDRRVRSFCENFQKKNTVHVYIVLSELSFPYAFSLGWLTPTSTAQGELSEDEFGEHLPIGKIDEKKFNKGDIFSIHGFDLISQGNLDEAGAQLRKAEKYEPDSARIHNNLGVYFALTNQPKKAEEEFTAALQSNPDYAVAQINAAWFELSTKKSQDAYDIAHAVLKRVHGFPPAALAAGQAACALTYYNEAVELAKPYSKDLVLGARFMQLLADAHLALGDKNAAKSFYEKSALANPDSVETLLKLAMTEQATGNLDAAMKHARQAVEAAPEDPRAHFYLGMYQEMNRNYRASQLQLEQVLDLRPTDTVRQAAYGPLLRALLAQGNTKDADLYTKKWVKEYPGDAVCHYNRAWFVGRLKDAQSRTEAISEYKAALDLNPDLSQARYNLALLLLNAGQNQPAVLELKAFLKQSPQDQDAPKAQELVKRLEH